MPVQKTIFESPKAQRTRQYWKRKLKENVVGYLFIMPVIVGLLMFTLWPMINSFIMSFYPEYSIFGLKGAPNIAENFRRLFDDRNVGKSLGITFTYSIIAIPLGMVLSFLLALMVNWKIKGIGVFRLLFYLPAVIPMTVSGLLWRDILNSQWGIANAFLQALGGNKLMFLDDAKLALPTLIFIGLFGVGGGMVLWLAALKNVPQSLYESAKIDGAGRLRTLLRITLPMCTPIIFYNLIMGIIGSLQTFASIMTLVGQGGGRDQSMLFYVVYIYNAFYGPGKLVGYASMLSWVLFLIVAALTAVVFSTSKWVFYGENV